MAFKKAGGTQHRGGPRRVATEPLEPAAGSDVGTGMALVDIDPWGALAKLWDQPNEDKPADEREMGMRRPAKKPGRRRWARSS